MYNQLKATDEADYQEALKMLGKEDNEKLKKAYEFAKKAHLGQKRKSGEDYFTHPLAVAMILWDKYKDLTLTIAGFLHDTVEDCKEVEMKKIYEEFGEKVGGIVDAVTKGEETFYKGEEIFKDIKEKTLYGAKKDIRCVLLKLADREHNLATLEHMPENKQVKKSFESQALYLPLMEILGFNTGKCLKIEECNILFKNYLKENNLKEAKEIKNHLLNICFKNFNEELFDVVYKNTMNIVWEMENKQIFKELLETGWFDSEGVNVISFKGDLKGGFMVTFKIIGGNLYPNLKGIKLVNTVII